MGRKKEESLGDSIGPALLLKWAHKQSNFFRSIKIVLGKSSLLCSLLLSI